MPKRIFIQFEKINNRIGKKLFRNFNASSEILLKIYY